MHLNQIASHCLNAKGAWGDHRVLHYFFLLEKQEKNGKGIETERIEEEGAVNSSENLVSFISTRCV